MALDCPDAFPMGGSFTHQIEGSYSIFYVATSGLYVSHDSGWTWCLVSADHDFRSAHLHQSGGLYAIVEEDMRSRIVLSRDSGLTWDDISGDIGAGVSLLDIHDDPDNADGVVLRGNSVRGLILQTSDGGDHWESIPEWAWLSDHGMTTIDLHAGDCLILPDRFESPTTLPNFFERCVSESH
jgi:photosystem II stability/assembly factor-like uncharacterized protein